MIIMLQFMQDDLGNTKGAFNDMTAQTVSLLSILRRYLKTCIPFTAILLSLASSSLTLADSGRVYARVWTPTGTNSIKIVCGDGTCSRNLNATWCASNVPWESTLNKGEYHDFGWQGQVGHTLSITAYSQSNCQGQFLGRALSFMNNPGDCWFDIPSGSVSGPCNGTQEARS
jgi:hypothetical protein